MAFVLAAETIEVLGSQIENLSLAKVNLERSLRFGDQYMATLSLATLSVLVKLLAQSNWVNRGRSQLRSLKI